LRKDDSVFEGFKEFEDGRGFLKDFEEVAEGVVRELIGIEKVKGESGGFGGGE
jgi:hypothetical protein